MATANQTARQKFLEARKAGVDAVTARKEAYGDIAPAQAGGVVQAQPITPAIPPEPTAPVQPVTPPPATPTTPPATQVTGVDGQKFTQVPVDPTTGLSKPTPVTTAPVQQTEQDINKQYGGFIQSNGINSRQPLNNTVEQIQPAKEVKTEAPVDYTQAKGREQEITANLESFKAQGMTPEQILKASDYANASPEKKAMIEPYLKQTQPTIDSMFNSIVAKVDVPDAQKVLPSYKIAQNRYLKANMYASMTPSQVTQEMNASRLIEGSRTWEDLKTLNPKLAQDAQNLRIVNGSRSNIFTYVNNPDGTPVKDENGNPVVENNLIKTFTQDYLDDYGDFLREVYKPETMEEINAKIYTPDVKMAQDKATEIELELNAIEKDINSIEADIDKETVGSGATGSRARLEKAIRAEKLQNLYNSTLKNYETYANKANNLINQNTAIYQEAYKQNQALQNALATAGGAKFQSELALSQSQAEFEQKLAQQAQLANDPISATNQIIDTFAEMGIMADRSRQEIIADVQNKVARGIPLGQALTELQSAFKSKPLYKSMVDAQMRSLAPQQESINFSFANIGDGRIAVQNPRTGEVSFANAGSVSSSNAPTNASARYIDIPTGTDVGVQCGQFARTLCGMDATPGGNSLDARKKAYIDTAPVAGGMVLFTGSGYDKTYGHIAAIESVNPDGTISIVESNLKNDNRVTRRTISANDPAIHGFYNNTPLAKSTGTIGTQVRQDFTDSDIAVLGSVTKLDKQGKETLASNGFTERDWANFQAGLLPPTSAQKEESQSVVNKIDNILESDWRNAVGTWKGLPVAGTDRTVVEKKVNALIDSLAATNLDKLKGPMSDKDIVFLKNIATYLSTDLSEEEFLATINDIKTRYSKIVQGTPSANLSQPTQANIDTESEINAFDAWQANQ